MLNFSSIFLFLTLATFQYGDINFQEKNEDKGSIKGVITNEHSTPIQNALIYLNREDKLINVTTSDTLGRYNFTAIKEDTYTVSVSYVGYFKKEIKNVVISDGKKELDITMKELRCTHGHTP